MPHTGEPSLILRTSPHAQSLTTLREDIAQLDPRKAYAAGMLSAARLVEDGAFTLSPHIPSAKVVELLALASRIEAIADDLSLLGVLLDVEEQAPKRAVAH
jgi:hypothetical protein